MQPNVVSVGPVEAAPAQALNPLSQDRKKANQLARAEEEKAQVMSPSSSSGPLDIPHRTTAFGGWFIFLQVLFVILYASVAEYAPLAKGPTSAAMQAEAAALVEQYYPFFQHVHVMIYIGFGFLMTFPKGFNWGGVGFTLLVSAAAFQWSLLSNHFWHTVISGHSWHKLQIDLPTVITGDFAAGAVMITLGAVLGKVGPIQMLVLAMLEIIFYSINESIGVIEYKAVDVGGSMFVHAFGGFFGVGAALVLSRGHKNKRAEENAATTKYTDVFAMIGTVFLWMYWPSFNGALAEGTARHRVVINTVLALVGSCVTAYCCSFIFRGKRRFNMVDIQNATLAGGVTMGTSADIIVDPFAALLVGVAAGLLSTSGYNHILPALERTIGLHDTCGVLCLHALPGLLGGIIGCITTSAADKETYGYDVTTVFPARGNDERSAGTQASYQAAAAFTTFGISLLSGYVSGWIVRKMDPILDPPGQYPFEDSLYWEEEEEEQEHSPAPSPMAMVAPVPAALPGAASRPMEGLNALYYMTDEQFEQLRQTVVEGRKQLNAS
eukprot:Hpha_TRINITY_DN16193_c2_g4::TRINITY_DN16193_c2_g4_i1::g.3715::m.3715/K06580/SLC42A, RHAG, RHBG, RHCG, CD241; ammonium transporter Rh